MTDAATPKEPLLQYPCDYPIKVIGSNSEVFIAQVSDIIRQHFPDLNASRIKHSKSANGKFISISVMLHLHHEGELHAAYQAIKTVPGLQMVL